MNHVWFYVTLTGYLLTLLLVPFVLLQRTKEPVARLAWIMAIINLPFVGGLFFLIFGINRVQRRVVDKQAANVAISRSLPGLWQYQMIPGEALDDQSQRLTRLTSLAAGTRPCFGNSVDIVADTNRTLGLIEQAILGARETVNLEYYIWQPDRTGRRMRDLLVRRAKEGIRIRFLYDGVGSFYLGRKFLKPMRDVGIAIAGTLPGPSFLERWSINLRNHRKIVIVDGQTGFTGGMNIGNEYIGKDAAVGYWRDTHLRIRGPAVLQLQQVFAEDWYFATGEELTGREWYPHPQEAGDQIAQVVAGGPDRDVAAFHAIFFAAINEARERVTLATSYFIPTAALQMALAAAAARGVRVRLLMQGKGAHKFMVTAARAFYEPLMDAGVEVYEFDYGEMHAKTLTIDGNWSIVGTPNFDTRSLHLNFEVGVVLYGHGPAAQLEDQFERDLTRSRRIDPATWIQRPTPQKIAEQFLRLFSPVL